MRIKRLHWSQSLLNSGLFKHLITYTKRRNYQSQSLLNSGLFKQLIKERPQLPPRIRLNPFLIQVFLNMIAKQTWVKKGLGLNPFLIQVFLNQDFLEAWAEITKGSQSLLNSGLFKPAKTAVLNGRGRFDSLNPFLIQVFLNRHRRNL